MRRKVRKKVRKSILLSLLCLLIILPSSAFANLNTTDDTSTPVLENTEQIEVDATQPEVEPTPEPTSEATTVTEPETVVEPEAPVVTEPTDSVAGPTDPAVEPTEPVGTTAVPETAATIEPSLVKQIVVPEIGDVAFSPRNAKVGDTVKITAKITDDSAIVNEVVTILKDPNVKGEFNDKQFIRLRYDADDHQWIGFFIVQETWNPGYWQARIIANYSDEARHRDQAVKKVENAFNILNNGDSTPPQFIEIDANPNPVIAGEKVAFSATIKDVNNLSDVVYAHLGLDFIHYNNKLGMVNYNDEELILLKYDSESEEWKGTYTVPANVPNNTKIYYSIVFADKAGNIMGDFSNNKEYFLVSNPEGGDTRPPELKKVISPVEENTFKVTKKQNATVPVRVKVSDKSGVKSVSAELFYFEGFSLYNNTLDSSEVSWNTREKTHVINLVNFDPDSNVWEGDFNLTVNDQDGMYYIFITAEDTYGNSDTYLLGDTFTLITLQNEFSDGIDPVINDVNFEGTPIMFGQEMKIAAKVKDKVEGYYSSGINFVKATITYPTLYASEEVYLTLNSETGRYEGSYYLKQNDDYIDLSIVAADNAGNFSEAFYKRINVKNLKDYLPPYIDFVKYPPATMYQGEVAHFETRLVDEGTGIHSATITLINVMDIMNNPVAVAAVDGPGREMAVAKSFPLTFNPTTDVWEIDWRIPTDSPTGLFLVNLTVFDKVGNKRDIINDGEYGNIPQTLVILPKPVVSGGGTVTPTPVNNPTTPTVTPVVAPTKTTTKLPDTATNNFNLLFAGMALVVIGGSRFVLRRRVGK